jgi:hypothetical protein
VLLRVSAVAYRQRVLVASPNCFNAKAEFNRRTACFSRQGSPTCCAPPSESSTFATPTSDGFYVMVLRRQCVLKVCLPSGADAQIWQAMTESKCNNSCLGDIYTSFAMPNEGQATSSSSSECHNWIILPERSSVVLPLSNPRHRPVHLLVHSC